MAQSRDAEQQMALDWLFEQIQTEQPDVLVVAGDIYDVSNPPVSAEEMYYQFLTRLTHTQCRCVVIIGGNHDSPYRLNAPRGLLRALNMYVVGAAGVRGGGANSRACCRHARAAVSAVAGGGDDRE